MFSSLVNYTIIGDVVKCAGVFFSQYRIVNELNSAEISSRKTHLGYLIYFDEENVTKSRLKSRI